MSKTRNPWLRPAGAEGYIPVVVLWDRLAALYGSRWRDLFPTDSSRIAWQEEAAAVLYGRGIKYVMVKGALDKLRNVIRADVPVVGIAEFADMCAPQFDFEGAYHEARSKAPLVDLGMADWSDPVVYWAARDFGFHRVCQTPWSRAKGEWVRAVTNRLQGTVPAIPVAEKVQYARGNMQLAIDTLGALKSMLGVRA